jgi:pimeloyl-ACP methyl ester carboxylesterase
MVRTLVMADTIGGIHSVNIERYYRDYTARLSAVPAEEIKPLDRHPALAADLGTRDRARAFLYNQISSTSLAPPIETLRRQLPESFWPAKAVAQMKVPTLFIVGEQDDIFSPAIIREAAAKVAGSVVREIPVAGHSPYFETPDVWNKIVHEFIGAHG